MTFHVGTLFKSVHVVARVARFEARGFAVHPVTVGTFQRPFFQVNANHVCVWIVGVDLFAVDLVILCSLDDLFDALVLVTAQTPIPAEISFSQRCLVLLLDKFNALVQLLLNGGLVTIQAAHPLNCVRVDQQRGTIPRFQIRFHDVAGRAEIRPFVITPACPSCNQENYNHYPPNYQEFSFLQNTTPLDK